MLLQLKKVTMNKLIVSVIYNPSPAHHDPKTLIIPMADPSDGSDYGSQPLAIEDGAHSYYAELVPFIEAAFPDMLESGRIQISAPRTPTPATPQPQIAPIPQAHPYAGTVYEVLPPLSIAQWPGGLSAVAKEHHGVAIEAVMNLLPNDDEKTQILTGWAKLYKLPPGSKSRITRALKALEGD
jgi:hypothetical protein